MLAASIIVITIIVLIIYILVSFLAALNFCEEGIMVGSDALTLTVLWF